MGKLDVIDVRNPCDESWDHMTGDARERHCAVCNKSVFNLSAMPAGEAETLLAGDGKICVRFFRRADGTVVTHDCNEATKLPRIRLGEFEVDPEIAQLLPREVAEKRRVFPVNRMGATLILAMSNPRDIFAIDDVKFLTGLHVEAVVATDAEIGTAIERYHGEPAEMFMGEIADPSIEPDPLLPETPVLDRDFVLAEVTRLLHRFHPDHADAMLRELARRTLPAMPGDDAQCPHCEGAVRVVKRG